jgi:hypothetical protein
MMKKSDQFWMYGQTQPKQTSKTKLLNEITLLKKMTKIDYF